MEIIQWNENSEPRRSTLADVLYNIRREDPENQLMDSVTPEDIIADSEGVLQFDALVIPYQQLQRRMTIMRRLMNRVGTTLKVEEDTDEVKGMVISEPFKKNGAAHIAVTFNLEDGQTITVFFHNPDATPQKIGPQDDLISWKWLINKKDVTIVVAPEHGKDLDVHEVARRIMKLADKNSAAFARANAKKAERLKKIEEQESEIEKLERELADAKAAFEEMKADAEAQAKRRADVEAKYLAAEKRVTSLTAERNTLKAKKEADAAAKKANNEQTEAQKNFPPIKDNNDFADFQNEHEDDGYQPGDAHNQHMLKYLVSTGQTHFSAKIPETDGTFGDGVARRKTVALYDEWKYENGKWAVMQGENGYWDDTAANKDYWAFHDFAIGVRNGSLKVLSGGSKKPTKVNLSSMTEGQFLEMAKAFADGDDSNATAMSVASALDRGDRVTLAMLVSMMQGFGYDAFCFGTHAEKYPSDAWKLETDGWHHWAWSSGQFVRGEVKKNVPDTMIDVLQELGNGANDGTLRKGTGGLDAPRMQADEGAKPVAKEMAKVKDVKDFCARVNKYGDALKYRDEIRIPLMTFLEEEHPSFTGSLYVSHKGYVADRVAHWEYRQGEWYRTFPLERKKTDRAEISLSSLDPTRSQIIFDFRDMEEQNAFIELSSKAGAVAEENVPKIAGSGDLFDVWNKPGRTEAETKACGQYLSKVQPTFCVEVASGYESAEIFQWNGAEWQRCAQPEMGAAGKEWKACSVSDAVSWYLYAWQGSGRSNLIKIPKKIEGLPTARDFGQAGTVAEVRSIEDFCKLFDRHGFFGIVHAPWTDRVGLYNYLKSEWPSFHGKTKASVGKRVAKLHDVVCQYRDGGWFVKFADLPRVPEKKMSMDPNNEDLEDICVLQYFRGMVEAGTLARWPENSAEKESAPDSDWTAAEAELNQIISGTHPKFGDESLMDVLTAYYQKYENDPEKIAVVNSAIDAWQTAALNASAEITSGKAK